jgi:hypothetical protein
MSAGAQRPVERRLGSLDTFAIRRKAFIESDLASGLAGDGSAGPGIAGRSRAEIERAAFV